MKIFALKMIVFIEVFFFFSCKHYPKNNNTSDDSNTIAYIDSIPISFDEVDKLCRQELFDQLSRIHLIRKITLEQIIKDKVLQLEAIKSNITVEQLKNTLYKNKVTSDSLEKFGILTNHTEKVTELRETLLFHDVKSAKGQEILIIRYKEYILHQFVDSLKRLHKINVTMKPPKSPKVKIDNLMVHYKGNLNSAVTFLIVSDFDCHMCREENSFFENLYTKYKDKVRFGFTHYSSYVSNSAIASECAANQDKFWEMHDSIFSPKMIPDSVALFRIAKNLKLDMHQFSADYQNKALSENIKANLYKLESAGIYGTPTIMINDRLIFNNTSIGEIEKMLEEVIAKGE